MKNSMLLAFALLCAVLAADAWSGLDQVSPVSSQELETMNMYSREQVAPTANLGYLVNRERPAGTLRDAAVPAASFEGEAAVPVSSLSNMDTGLRNELLMQTMIRDSMAQAPTASFEAATPVSSRQLDITPTASFNMDQEEMLYHSQFHGEADAPVAAFGEKVSPTASFGLERLEAEQIAPAAFHGMMKNEEDVSPTSSFHLERRGAQEISPSAASSMITEEQLSPTSSFGMEQEDIFPAASFIMSRKTIPSHDTMKHQRKERMNYITPTQTGSSMHQAPTSSLDADFETMDAPTSSLQVDQAPTASMSANYYHNRRLLQATDVCTTPPTCAVDGPYVECEKGGRLSCVCSWVSRCQPNVSNCYLHTNDKIYTSCGF